MPHARIIQLDRVKPVKCNINGVLLLNKPFGITSNRALQIVKRLFFAKKAGHTGTLDPMATGLLPICFGEATKFSSLLLCADKTYQATIKLGYISTTGDSEGEISTAEKTKPIGEKLTSAKIESVLQNFVGKTMQKPPMYSALKYQGKPLYAYARKGEDVERAAREIIIYDLQVESFVENELQITVKCGTGTYIRTLAEDIGRELGYGGAYLIKLCRSSIGSFDFSRAYTIDDLAEMSSSQRESCLFPVDSLLGDFSAIVLDSVAAVALLQGRVAVDQAAAINLSEGERVRLYNQEKQFLGLGEILMDNKIIPKRMMTTNY